jgi:hypothetical protein
VAADREGGRGWQLVAGEETATSLEGLAEERGSEMGEASGRGGALAARSDKAGTHRV